MKAAAFKLKVHSSSNVFFCIDKSESYIFEMVFLWASCV